MKTSETFWDKQSDKFDQPAKHFEQTTLKTIEHTKKYLNASDIVLDFGCATGTLTYEFADHVKEIHGIDISSKMIEAAQRKADERNIENINFAQATLFDKGYTRESFDVILAFSVLHLVEDTQKVIQKVHELLRPGGLCISSTVCFGEKKTLLSMLLSLVSKIGLVPSMKFFTISELEDVIAHGSFKIVTTETLNHSPEEYFIVAKKIAST